MSGKRKLTERIINYFAENQMSLDAIKVFGAWLSDERDKDEKDKALYKLWDKNIVEEKMPIEKEGNKQKKGLFVSWKVLGGIAAAIVTLICVQITVLIKNTPDNYIRLVSSQDSKGEFQLPDGSRVWLNSNSYVEYNQEFEKNNERRIRVVGEAFFDVCRSSNPFIVELGNFDVRVMGTRFNVRNSKTFSIEEVTLESGSIMIESPTNGKISLKPGECFFYNPMKDAWRVERVKTSNYTNWIKPAINFEGERLYDIVKTLEHWYNTNITIEDNVDSSVRISFSLTPESIEETMNVICILTGYETRILNRNNIIIYKK